MKLELRHLAPYLPYGLKYFIDFEDGDTACWKVEGLTIQEIFIDGYDCNYDSKNCKPILRPLSDFEKVICKELMIKFSTSLIIIHEIWALIQKDKTLNQINYETYLFMCKNHVDFNNLIEENLAIDINTIK